MGREDFARLQQALAVANETSPATYVVQGQWFRQTLDKDRVALKKKHSCRLLFICTKAV
jgi:hypothetical protein